MVDVGGIGWTCLVVDLGTCGETSENAAPGHLHTDLIISSQVKGEGIAADSLSMRFWSVMMAAVSNACSSYTCSKQTVPFRFDWGEGGGSIPGANDASQG